MLTFKEMYTQIGQAVFDTSTGRTTRIKDALNRRYIHLATSRRWTELYEFEETLTLADANNSNTVFIPKRARLVYKLVQNATPEMLINTDFGHMLEQRFFVLNTGGKAVQASPLKKSPIKRVISSAETMDFVSSDSSDTSGITVVIRGLVGENTLTESITINGTTTVATTNSYTQIYSIGVDGVRTGVLTMSGTTSSVEYATIAPTESGPLYQMVRLWPIGATTDTYSVFYKRQVEPMKQDGDVPDIPVSEALVEFGIADINRQMKRGIIAREHEARGNQILDGDQMESMLEGNNVQVSQPLTDRLTRDTPVTVVNNG